MPFYNLFGVEQYKLNTYPLNLLYLATFMRRNGYACEILDGEILQFNIKQKNKNDISTSISKAMNTNANQITMIMGDENHEVWQTLRDKILERKPDLIGITCYSSSMNAARNMCNLIKQKTNIPIVIGGPHVSAIPKASLQFSEADYAVSGEGEVTLLELVKKIEGRDSHSIDGLYYWQGANVVCDGNRNLIADVNTIPIPDRQLLDMDKYCNDTHLILTTRGCPYDCGYCASEVTWERKIRYRSVDSLIEELTMLRDLFNAKFIRIVDDTFTLNKKRVLSICNEIKKNGLDTIMYSAGARIETLDEEVIAALKQANFETLSLGIESASPKILKTMDKNMDIKKASNVIKLMKEAGIKSHTFFMIGYPNENLDDIQLSKDFISKTKPTEIEINMVTPYPGTRLWYDVFGETDPSKTHNWFQWFHQGIATHNVDFDLEAEYANFIEFINDYKSATIS